MIVIVDKSVCTSTDNNQPNIGITIYGKPIDPVTEFVYLGQKLSEKLPLTIDHDCR